MADREVAEPAVVCTAVLVAAFLASGLFALSAGKPAGETEAAT